MFTLGDLEEIIARRAEADTEASYTASLIGKGASHCARKMGEEAIETILAVASGDRDAIRSETADLLYHLLVALKASGVRLEEVLAELQSRTRQSGLEEKAGRTARRAR